MGDFTPWALGYLAFGFFLAYGSVKADRTRKLRLLGAVLILFLWPFFTIQALREL